MNTQIMFNFRSRSNLSQSPEERIEFQKQRLLERSEKSKQILLLKYADQKKRMQMKKELDKKQANQEKLLTKNIKLKSKHIKQMMDKQKQTLDKIKMKNILERKEQVSKMHEYEKKQIEIDQKVREKTLQARESKKFIFEKEIRNRKRALYNISVQHQQDEVKFGQTMSRIESKFRSNSQLLSDIRQDRRMRITN